MSVVQLSARYRENNLARFESRFFSHEFITLLKIFKFGIFYSNINEQKRGLSSACKYGIVSTALYLAYNAMLDTQIRLVYCKVLKQRKHALKERKSTIQNELY